MEYTWWLIQRRFGAFIYAEALCSRVLRFHPKVLTSGVELADSISCNLQIWSHREVCVCNMCS